MVRATFIDEKRAPCRVDPISKISASGRSRPHTWFSNLWQSPVAAQFGKGGMSGSGYRRDALAGQPPSSASSAALVDIHHHRQPPNLLRRLPGPIEPARMRLPLAMGGPQPAFQPRQQSRFSTRQLFHGVGSRKQSWSPPSPDHGRALGKSRRFRPKEMFLRKAKRDGPKTGEGSIPNVIAENRRNCPTRAAGIRTKTWSTRRLALWPAHPRNPKRRATVPAQ